MEKRLSPIPDDNISGNSLAELLCLLDVFFYVSIVRRVLKYWMVLNFFNPFLYYIYCG